MRTWSVISRRRSRPNQGPEFNVAEPFYIIGSKEYQVPPLPHRRCLCASLRHCHVHKARKICDGRVSYLKLYSVDPDKREVHTTEQWPSVSAFYTGIVGQKV